MYRSLDAGSLFLLTCELFYPTYTCILRVNSPMMVDRLSVSLIHKVSLQSGEKEEALAMTLVEPFTAYLVLLLSITQKR